MPILVKSAFEAQGNESPGATRVRTMFPNV